MAALINGVNYSWANISFVLFGIPFVGITKISYKKKQTKENNYGIGSEPISRGYGNKEYEGTITIYTDDWMRIIKQSPNNDPLDIPPFEIPVIYSGDNVVTTQDTLQMVEFMENPLDANQGDTKLMIEIPLIIGGIKRKGA